MKTALALVATLALAAPSFAKQPKHITAGGDTCASPTTICPGCPSNQPISYTDTGDTSAAANDVSSIPAACPGGPVNPNFTGVSGRDHIYAFSIPAGTFTNDLTFTVTPIGPDSAWDPAIYVLGTCGNTPSCLAKRDEGGTGVAETIPSGIQYLPGPHALYIDSALAVGTAAGAGNYRVDVTGFLPVELFHFQVE